MSSLRSVSLSAPSQARVPPRVLRVRGVALTQCPLQPSVPRAQSSQCGHSLCSSVCACSGGRADQWDACRCCPNPPRALVLSPQWISETTACTSSPRSRKKFRLLVGNVPGRPSLGPDLSASTMLRGPVLSFPRKLWPGLMSQPSQMFRDTGLGQGGDVCLPNTQICGRGVWRGRVWC